jgi:aminotransferase
MIADYDRRRRFFVEGLNGLGMECHVPQGAFYTFPSIRSSGLSCEEFAERLLLEEHVAVVPGNAFGPGGEGHVRCSYATAYSALEEALRRIERFLTRLHHGSEPRFADGLRGGGSMLAPLPAPIAQDAVASYTGV